jgi:hypothetical protein
VTGEPHFKDGHVELNRKKFGHLMPLLRGRNLLWHTTHPEAFYSIIHDGKIRPSGETTTKWESSLGKRLGAVCLLDFDGAEEH